MGWRGALEERVRRANLEGEPKRRTEKGESKRRTERANRKGEPKGRIRTARYKGASPDGEWHRRREEAFPLESIRFPYLVTRSATALLSLRETTSAHGIARTVLPFVFLFALLRLYTAPF